VRGERMRVTLGVPSRGNPKLLESEEVGGVEHRGGEESEGGVVVGG